MKRYKQWIFLDNFKRKIFIKFALKKKLFKSLIKNDSIPLVYRYYFYYNQTKITNFAMKSKHVNRCVRTGRNKGVINHLKYSRFVIRNEINDGNFPGYRRASW